MERAELEDEFARESANVSFVRFLSFLFHTAETHHFEPAMIRHNSLHPRKKV